MNCEDRGPLGPHGTRSRRPLGEDADSYDDCHEATTHLSRILINVSLAFSPATAGFGAAAPSTTRLVLRLRVVARRATVHRTDPSGMRREGPRAAWPARPSRSEPLVEALGQLEVACRNERADQFGPCRDSVHSRTLLSVGRQSDPACVVIQTLRTAALETPARLVKEAPTGLRDDRDTAAR
jgi:hypothetical protein